jgi:MoaA/NifB/PqqE/SkfB family radical SAM enzyme
MCPDCARVHDGKLNENLILKDMKLEDYKRIFKPDLFKRLDFISFCGSFGDVATSNTFLDCVKYIRQYNVRLYIFSNGSLRSESWWKELAKLLDYKCTTIFSIDGLEDTSPIYRINSDFNKAIKNAKAFIDAGGKARWDYLVFDYNKHQIEEARKLAKEMGFHIFNEKWSQRKIGDKILRKNPGVNDNLPGKIGKVIKKYRSWNNYVNETPIKCRYKREGQIFIDYDLKLWPCCWIAPCLYYTETSIQRKHLEKSIENYEEDFNSLKEKTIEEVLNHKWFREDLPNSWLKTVDDGKMFMCGKYCGSEFTAAGAAPENRNLIEFKKGETND